MCWGAAAKKRTAARSLVRRDRDNDRSKKVPTNHTGSKKPEKMPFPGLARSVRQKFHQDTLDTKGSFREVAHYAVNRSGQAGGLVLHKKS